MNIVESIQELDMPIDEKYLRIPLKEALDTYHELIEKNIIRPRENQLNQSGTMPRIIHFNQGK